MPKFNTCIPIGIMLWLFGVVVGLFIIDTPLNNKELVVLVASFVTGVILGGMFGFYFGDNEENPKNGD